MREVVVKAQALQQQRFAVDRGSEEVCKRRPEGASTTRTCRWPSASRSYQKRSVRPIQCGSTVPLATQRWLSFSRPSLRSYRSRQEGSLRWVLMLTLGQST
jgi:hypothetical protein